jgi:lysozyme family protein
MTERFKKFFKEMLENEGGYVDDPHDSGGKTLWGISANNFPDTYRNVKQLFDEGQIDLAKLTAMNFYYKNFYNTLYDEIQDVQLAFRLFDFGVNAGVKRAVKILQNVMNENYGYKLKIDGVFGELTLHVVNKVGEPVYRSYEIALEKYYKSLKTFWKFGRGWLKRLFRNPFKKVL